MFIDFVETHSKIIHCLFAVFSTDLLLYSYTESFDSGEGSFIAKKIPSRKLFTTQSRTVDRNGWPSTKLFHALIS